MRNSKSEVVVITGASAGIGRATVREFAKQGASIGLLAGGHRAAFHPDTDVFKAAD